MQAGSAPTILPRRYGFLTAAYIVDPEDPDPGPTWRLSFFEKSSRARYLFWGGQSVRIA